MRTPAGSDCPFYYEDFHRGRAKQECRLIARSRNTAPWGPSLCQDCAVPRITRANACQHLTLEARVETPWFGFGRKQVKVIAACTKALKEVSTPEVGCGQCHDDRLDQLALGV